MDATAMVAKLRGVKDNAEMSDCGQRGFVSRKESRRCYSNKKYATYATCVSLTMCRAVMLNVDVGGSESGLGWQRRRNGNVVEGGRVTRTRKRIAGLLEGSNLLAGTETVDGV